MAEDHAVDRGYWITWYDLPEAGRQEYLDWLHTSYISELLKAPRVLSGAHYQSLEKVQHPGTKGRLSHTSNDEVPTGDRYILIITGEDAHAFSNPPPSKLHKSLSDEDQKMLALRIGERVNIMVDEARVDGPAVATRDGVLLSPCIQLGNFNSSHWHDEEELTAWYAQWRMLCMQEMEGSVATRKLVSVSGWAKHAILYEFTSAEMRNKNFIDHESHNPKMEAWTDRVVRKLNHAPGSPNLAERIWPRVL